MLAAALPEQSAKRVVSQCGLIGSAAAVSTSYEPKITKQDRKPMNKWLLRLLETNGVIMIPSAHLKYYEFSPQDDFGDALLYALFSKKRKG